MRAAQPGSAERGLESTADPAALCPPGVSPDSAALSSQSCGLSVRETISLSCLPLVFAQHCIGAPEVIS